MTTESIDTAPRWLTDPAQLTALLAAAAPTRVALDTEFIRERTWWPILALVQLAFDETIVLVDPLAPGMPAALAPLLADPGVLKVLHSGSEDLVALKHACGVVPQPLFDTQVAASLAGVGGGMGYQRLVQEMLGVTLAKGETRSDWLRRPLSAAQLEYAADDVRHLFALHDGLADKLAQLGRSGWLDEDCARMASNAERDELEPWPHLSMRAAQYLDAAAQLRLLRLLRWRDAYARDTDKPRTWILENDFAVTLARSALADVEAVQRKLDAQPKAPRSLANAIWQALSTPLPDEADAPQPRNEDRDKPLMRRLQQAIAASSAELGLPDGVLASRRWLERLLDLANPDGSLVDKPWPGQLGGWRRAYLQPALAMLARPANPDASATATHAAAPANGTAAAP